MAMYIMATTTTTDTESVETAKETKSMSSTTTAEFVTCQSGSSTSCLKDRTPSTTMNCPWHTPTAVCHECCEQHYTARDRMDKDPSTSKRYRTTYRKAHTDYVAEVAASEMDLYAVVSALIKADVRVLLYGKPGTGKTSLAQRVLADACGGGDNVSSITLTEETSASELLGHFVVKGGDFVWHDGPATRAWRLDGGLILNELDKAVGPAHTACHAICDDRKVAQVTLASGETVKPGNRFRVIATMNGVPSDLPEALRDRFAVAIHVERPSKAMIDALPEQMRPVAIAAYEENKTPDITYRKLQAWAKVEESLANITTKEQRMELMRGIFGAHYRDVYHALVLGERK